jgi:hypothetical protein
VCAGGMDDTNVCMLWNVVPEVPKDRKHSVMSLEESVRRRESDQEDISRLNATLARNHTVCASNRG